MTRIEQLRAWPVALCLGLALGLAMGCGKDKPSTKGNDPPPNSGDTKGSDPKEVLAKLPGGEEFAAGKKVYAENNCAHCHRLGETGEGPPPAPPGAPAPPAPPGLGPDLTRVGAPTEHTKQWLTDHIRNAKQHTSDSRMPQHGVDRISDADLKSLVDYLASRK